MQTALFLRPTGKAIANAPNRVRFDWDEPSWGWKTSISTTPVTAAEMRNALTRAPESVFINPVLNWMSCGSHMFKISIRKNNRTPFVLSHTYDNEPKGPPVADRRLWSAVRNRNHLINWPVADTHLSSPPLREIDLHSSFSWTNTRDFPRPDREWVLHSDEANGCVRVCNFVELVDMFIEICNEDVKWNKNEDGTYLLAGFTISWLGN